VKKHLGQVQDEFDRLTTTRQRMLERPLQKIEALRLQRSLSIDDVEELDDADNAPVLRAVGHDD
jgi:DNA anti-recombination protein RmuC